MNPSADTSRLTTPAREVALSRVTDEPLDVRAHAAAVGRDSAGAVVTFEGVVRDHDHGRGVRHLRYVAHPSAGDVLARVVAEVTAASDVDAAAVSHRIGELAVGDVALAVAVSAAHRSEAFAACAQVVEAVKEHLPVWKEQHFTDGTSQWVACP